jgi:predicted glycosyltransferase
MEAKNIGYAVQFSDRHTCSVIESMKPGDERTVLVVPEINSKAEPKAVRAKRSQDGEEFMVIMPDGVEAKWLYDDLKNTIIPHYKPSV